MLKSIRHIISQAGWTIDTWHVIHFMLFTLNSDPIASDFDKQKSRLIKPGTIFPVFYCSVLMRPCELYTPFPVLCWQEWHLLLSSAAVLPPLQVSTVQRCSPAYLGSNNWLSELLLASCQLKSDCQFSSDLWHQQGFCFSEHCNVYKSKRAALWWAD